MIGLKKYLFLLLNILTITANLHAQDVIFEAKLCLTDIQNKIKKAGNDKTSLKNFLKSKITFLKNKDEDLYNVFISYKSALYNEKMKSTKMFIILYKQTIKNFHNWVEKESIKLNIWDFHLLDIVLHSYAAIMNHEEQKEVKNKVHSILKKCFKTSLMGSFIINKLEELVTLKNENFYNQPAAYLTIKYLLKNEITLKFLKQELSNYFIARYYYLPYKKVVNEYQGTKDWLDSRANKPQKIRDLQRFIENQYMNRDNHGYIGGDPDYRSNHAGVHGTLSAELLDDLLLLYREYWKYDKKRDNEVTVKRLQEEDKELYFLLFMGILLHDIGNINEDKDIPLLSSALFEIEMGNLGFPQDKIKLVSDALDEKEKHKNGKIKDISLLASLIQMADALELPRTYHLGLLTYNPITCSDKSLDKILKFDKTSGFDVTKLTLYPHMKDKDKTEETLKAKVREHLRLDLYFASNMYLILNECQKAYDKTYTQTCEKKRKFEKDLKKHRNTLKQKKQKSNLSMAELEAIPVFSPKKIGEILNNEAQKTLKSNVNKISGQTNKPIDPLLKNNSGQKSYEKNGPQIDKKKPYVLPERKKNKKKSVNTKQKKPKRIEEEPHRLGDQNDPTGRLADRASKRRYVLLAVSLTLIMLSYIFWVDIKNVVKQLFNKKRAQKKKKKKKVSQYRIKIN